MVFKSCEYYYLILDLIGNVYIVFFNTISELAISIECFIYFIHDCWFFTIGKDKQKIQNIFISTLYQNSIYKKSEISLQFTPTNNSSAGTCTIFFCVHIFVLPVNIKIQIAFVCLQCSCLTYAPRSFHIIL